MKVRKINACIIGYGSIGQRHAKILKKSKNIKRVYILTKRNVPKKYIKLKNFEECLSKEIDYFLISNRTSEHFNTLKKINKFFKSKIILVEKPLFEKYRNLKLKNFVYVGYNMRFNPIIKKIKEETKNQKVWSVNLICSSFLPHWRKKINYTKTYSAQKKLGGGVLLDLSHELDYLIWIFGNIKINYFYSGKVSNLKITSKDYFNMQGTIKKKCRFNLELSYFSRLPIRRILIEGNNLSIEGDLIKKVLFIKKNNKFKKFNFLDFSRDYSYSEMHYQLLSGKNKNHCNFKQGLNLMKVIDRVK